MSRGANGGDTSRASPDAMEGPHTPVTFRQAQKVDRAVPAGPIAFPHHTGTNPSSVAPPPYPIRTAPTSMSRVTCSPSEGRRAARARRSRAGVLRAPGPSGQRHRRIVVSGMAIRHVARNIAATFASTGTPALFVHPAEASHGDLGMILLGDAVLALSNSGETAELADIVAHARRFGLKLVAITARTDSTLARAADVALLLPAAPEACPMGLAPPHPRPCKWPGRRFGGRAADPRGFTEAEFRGFHPGGRLGARLRRVRELMHTGDAVPLAAIDMPMDRALVLMTEMLRLSRRDRARRHPGRHHHRRRPAPRHGPRPADRPAGRYVDDPRSQDVGPDALAAEALHAMNAHERPVTALFVVGPDSKVAGILHIHDLLRAGLA